MFFKFINYFINNINYNKNNNIYNTNDNIFNIHTINYNKNKNNNIYNTNNTIFIWIFRIIIKIIIFNINNYIKNFKDAYNTNNNIFYINTLSYNKNNNIYNTNNNIFDMNTWIIREKIIFITYIIILTHMWLVGLSISGSVRFWTKINNQTKLLFF